MAPALEVHHVAPWHKQQQEQPLASKALVAAAASDIGLLTRRCHTRLLLALEI